MSVHAPSVTILFERLLSMFPPSIQPKEKPTVVVLGSGWGSHAFVSNLDRTKYDVKVVSTSPSRLNQPRLIADLYPSFKKLPIRPDIDKCLSINQGNQSVLGAKSRYEYDYLVIATGSEPNDFGTKGVKEHCLMFKTVDDLQKLRNRLHDNQRVTVIGAGPTGIELAFKLQSLGHTVTIIEASQAILPGFSQWMQSQTMKLLNERNINVRLNMKITRIDETTISTPDGLTRRDPLLIWTCGVKPTEFVRELTPAGRQLQTDGNLMFQPRIYALGDIVAAHGPPTAQNAKQQGTYLANHFNNNFKSHSDYKYNEKGRILDTTDGLLVEYKGHTMTFPPLFRKLLYYFAD
jgi:NADH dehydrogenase FAD-containing subunit